jgi:23S rRNA pseudouridine1911/1915/1917 synthase
MDCAVSIVAEADEYVVVNKPAFLEVHPSKPGGRATLWDGLRELLAFEIINGGQVSIVTRLDRETSGLVLVAKTREAARRFHQLMEARAIHKEYLAIVWGWPHLDRFIVDAPVVRQGAKISSPIYLKRMVHREGAPARTDFVVERRFSRHSTNGGEFALIRAFPQTGRTHQIRVHLAHAGHPIVGDKLYGPDELCYLEFIRTGWSPALESRLLLARHALHATALAIPALDLHWQTTLPSDLVAWIAGIDDPLCSNVTASRFEEFSRDQSNGAPI